MGVKVNESGTLKTLSLDTDDVETLRVHLQIPAVVFPAAGKYIRCSDLGITNVYYTSKYSTDSDNIKGPPLLSKASSSSTITWSEIPDEYKVVVKRGQFNFKLTAPCKFKEFSSSTSYSSIDNLNDFPKKTGNGGFSGKLCNEAVVLGNAKTSSWECTAKIGLVLIIEPDGVNYRVEACCIRTSQISEYNALNDKYGIQIADSVYSTKPYTVYFDGFDNDYLIEKSPYSEKTYTVDSIITAK